MSRRAWVALVVGAMAAAGGLGACGGRIDAADFAIDAAVDAAPPLVTPTMVVSPPPGTFAAAPAITITFADPDGRLGPLDLWYTTDGSPPVIGTSTRAQPGVPFTLDRSRGLRVFAADPNGAIRFSFFGAYLVVDSTVATFSSNLPVLVLWGETVVPVTKDEPFVASSLSVFEPGAGRVSWPGPSQQTVRAGIKIRGSSTAGYPKHPWHVETRSGLVDGDAGLALLGMAAESDWALNAPLDFDRALMRNSLAFALSNAMERWAPRTEFAEVFIAGTGETVGLDDYVGVYEVTEMIKRGDDRVDIAELRRGDIAPPKVTGGYIFKEDRLGPGEAGFRAGSGVPANTLYFQNSFVLVEPEEADAAPEQKAYLKQYLDDVGVAVTSPTFTTPAGVHYSQLIDVDGFIDHNIVNMFTRNPDAFRLSGYYTKDRDGLLVEGPVWDFDRTMGCTSDDRARDPIGWGDTGGVGFFDHGFYRGLFRDPVFRARYFDRLGQLLKGPLSPRATARWIDGWAPRLEEAAARNFARWTSYPPRMSYANEVALLKQWLATRAEWMTSCLALPDPRTCM